MTGEIFDAIIQEMLAMPDFTGGGGEGTVIKRTDFRLNKINTYGMPLLLAEILDGEESGQVLGGVKRADWRMGFNCYHYDPDITGDDKTSYSATLLNVMDRVVDHFNTGSRRSFIYPGSALTPGVAYTVMGAATDTITYNGNTYAHGSYFTAVQGVTSFTTNAGGYLMFFAWLTPGMAQILNDYGFRFTMGGISAADPLDADGLIMGFKVIFDSVGFDTGTANLQQSSSQVTAVQQVNNPPFDFPG